MRDAWKVMAEAMANELVRQSREPASPNVALKPRSPGNDSEQTFIKGWFDLERVARVALEAAPPFEGLGVTPCEACGRIVYVDPVRHAAQGFLALCGKRLAIGTQLGPRPECSRLAGS